MHYFSALFW